jgi:hypothetical protein
VYQRTKREWDLKIFIALISHCSPSKYRGSLEEEPEPIYVCESSPLQVLPQWGFIECTYEEGEIFYLAEHLGWNTNLQ